MLPSNRGFARMGKSEVFGDLVVAAVLLAGGHGPPQAAVDNGLEKAETLAPKWAEISAGLCGLPRRKP